MAVEFRCRHEVWPRCGFRIPSCLGSTTHHLQVGITDVKHKETSELTYQFEDIFFKLQSKILTGTNLNPCLLDSIMVICTFRKRFDSTYLSMIYRDRLLNDGACQFIEVGYANMTMRAVALNLDPLGDNCGLSRSSGWVLLLFVICWLGWFERSLGNEAGLHWWTPGKGFKSRRILVTINERLTVGDGRCR